MNQTGPPPFTAMERNLSAQKGIRPKVAPQGGMSHSAWQQGPLQSASPVLSSPLTSQQLAALSPPLTGQFWEWKGGPKVCLIPYRGRPASL